MSIAREGWPYIAVLLLAGGIVALRFPWVGGLLAFLGLFCAFFFRDPERTAPTGPRLVISPADGKVVQVMPAPEGHPLGNPLGPGAWQVSIFLSVFDVHVNRSPIAGTVTDVRYNPGEFLPAFDDKASLRNEQNLVIVEDGPHRVAFKQIAGLIARRIVFRKKPGDPVARGERIGLIKFGSRMDVFVPAGTTMRVQVGQRVSAGSSVLAELPEPPR
jgi:phosphatidylserine decarboxylase